MKKEKKIRYAIVGLGHIAQVAVLPAFSNSKTSELAALVSGDPKKLKVLSKRYKVKKNYSYDDFDKCLQDPSIHAIYIALPNAMHFEYALKCIEAGKHVLCEKPLTVTVADAKKIIAAAQKKNVKIMTAYRLHFDFTNLRAIQIAHSGKIGELDTSPLSSVIKSKKIISVLYLKKVEPLCMILEYIA